MGLAAGALCAVLFADLFPELLEKFIHKVEGTFFFFCSSMVPKIVVFEERPTTVCWNKLAYILDLFWLVFFLVVWWKQSFIFSCLRTIAMEAQQDIANMVKNMNIPSVTFFPKVNSVQDGICRLLIIEVENHFYKIPKSGSSKLKSIIISYRLKRTIETLKKKKLALFACIKNLKKLRVRIKRLHVMLHYIFHLKKKT